MYFEPKKKNNIKSSLYYFEFLSVYCYVYDIEQYNYIFFKPLPTFKKIFHFNFDLINCLLKNLNKRNSNNKYV